MRTQTKQWLFALLIASTVWWGITQIPDLGTYILNKVNTFGISFGNYCTEIAGWQFCLGLTLVHIFIVLLIALSFKKIFKW